MSQQSDSQGLEVEEEVSDEGAREKRYKWSQMSLDELVGVVHRAICYE